MFIVKFLKWLFSLYQRVVYPTTITYECDVPQDKALVLCGKHIGNLDGPLVWMYFPREVRYMAKAELFKNPLVKWYISKAGAFGVHRGSNDLGALKAAMAILKEGGVLGIFPEGTCVHDNLMREYKLGAVTLANKMQARLLPFGIYTPGYKRRAFKRCFIRFGKPVAPRQLGVTIGSKAELAEAGKKLMGIIQKLSEEHYEAEIS